MTYFRITELHRQRDKKVTGRVGEADRRVPRQPNVFIGTDGKVARYLLYFNVLNTLISYYFQRLILPHYFILTSHHNGLYSYFS